MVSASSLVNVSAWTSHLKEGVRSVFSRLSLFPASVSIASLAPASTASSTTTQHASHAATDLASLKALLPAAASGGGSEQVTWEFFSAHKRQILHVVKNLLGITVSVVVAYYLFKYMVQYLDPTNAEKLEAKQQAEKILKDIGIKHVELNEHELFIASNLIAPERISCTWQDIGGQEQVTREIRETVIYPLKNLFYQQQRTAGASGSSGSPVLVRPSRLIQPPKGVLLFGPPGCGKTMIAKAMAKESGARFIDLQVSTLFDKWYGESEKRTQAIFSLAAKVQPVIIFIDEIDTFLRSRMQSDHECSSRMKTQFMTMWDGLTTSAADQGGIVIVGATNRPDDVDAAILRRMPLMFYIGMPNAAQRLKILKIILRDEVLDADVDLEQLAKQTEGFSGSDLQELCRRAAMNTFLSHCRANKSGGDAMMSDDVELTNDDFKLAECGSGGDDANSGQPTSVLCKIRRIDFDVSREKMAVKELACRYQEKTSRNFFL